MNRSRPMFWAALTLALFASAFPHSLTPARADQSLLNVSYDPTREFYQDYNNAFARFWQAKTHQTVTIKHTHGGSGKQARSVIDGLEADVVTLALAPDIDAIQKAGLIAPGWASKFPDNSAPYTSTIVFVVRKGNPKGIHDWQDLVRPGIGIITPNPKTSGGARYGFLAAYGAALKSPGGSKAKALDYISRLYHNVPVLDTGSRAATITFAQRGQGDVLLAWENEALLLSNQLGHGQFEIVRPSISILAEPPVAVVDKNVDKHNTRAVATEYLRYLYSPEGQTIAARHYYRPRLASAAASSPVPLPKMRLFTVSLFGGWSRAQQTFFADGGVFDQIYKH